MKNKLIIILLLAHSIFSYSQNNDIMPFKVLQGHQYKVQNAFFSPDGNFIISHGWDNTVKLWDVKTFSEIRTFVGHTDQVWSAAISPDNKYIASGSMDRTFIIWDVETGEKKQQVQINPYNVKVKGMVPELDSELPNSIYGVSFSPNGKHLALASADKLVRIWDMEKSMFIDSLDGQHITNWMKCYYSPDGKYLISRSTASFRETGVNVIWETKTNNQINRIEMSGSIIFTKHNKLGIYAGNNIMNYYNLSDGGLAFQKPFPDFKGTLELSPDRKYLIAGRPEGDILIWTMESLIDRKRN